MKTMTVQELFGEDSADPGLPYYLCFLAGKLLITFETLHDRVATTEETKLLCKEVLEKVDINPQEDLITGLFYLAGALASSDEGIEFCKNFDARPDKGRFDVNDTKEVQEIVKKFMEEFYSLVGLDN